MVKSAMVIGSGIAGIAAAIRIRKKGYEVIVFEANDYVGGKMSVVEKCGYRWDAGPSLFTMPHYVDELFELFDEDPRQLFNYHRKEVICNYFWEDGTTYSVPSKEEDFISTAAHTFKVPKNALRSYLMNSKKKYDLTAGIFLESSLHKWSTYLSTNTLSSLLQSYKLDINSTLNEVNEDYFSSPHLVQLFNRYATYNGSSPYRTPGIMSIIPHLEMHFGTYFPVGGMHAISKSLYRLAIDKGINFRFNEPVEEILHDRESVIGIRTNLAEYPADLVVSNADVYSTYNRLLRDVEKPKKVLNQERSSSALIFYWGVRKNFHQLDLHNIFFSDDYQQEFQHIFDKKDVYQDPTIYINITSKDEPTDAPAGCENWFVMINTPGNFGQDWQSIRKQARQYILLKISRLLKTDIESLIDVEEFLDPVTIESKTNSHRGSLYGASSNSKFSAFLRHANFTSQVKNLYFCGGSVHPGGGIPLCLLSAKIVGDLIPEFDD